MRYIIVLIALLTLGVLLPSMWAQQPASVGSPVGLSSKAAPLAKPSETALITTPSISSFLGDDWMPPSAINATNTSLNNNSTAVVDTTAAPIYTAMAANKDGVVAWTGESRFQFLQDDWTPSTPVEVIQTAPYTKHKMS